MGRCAITPVWLVEIAACWGRSGTGAWAAEATCIGCEGAAIAMGTPDVAGADVAVGGTFSSTGAWTALRGTRTGSGVAGESGGELRLDGAGVAGSSLGAADDCCMLVRTACEAGITA